MCRDLQVNGDSITKQKGIDECRARGNVVGHERDTHLSASALHLPVVIMCDGGKEREA